MFVHADIAGEANLLLSGRLFGAPLGTTVVGALAPDDLRPRAKAFYPLLKDSDEDRSDYLAR